MSPFPILGIQVPVHSFQEEGTPLGKRDKEQSRLLSFWLWQNQRYHWFRYFWQLWPQAGTGVLAAPRTFLGLS